MAHRFLVLRPVWCGRMFLNRLLAAIALIALLPAGMRAAERPAPKFLLDSPTLTAAEKFVLAQLRAGKPADLKSQFPNETNRILRAAFLEAVLTQTGTNVHRNGFAIEHAVIPDAFDLRNAEVHFETSLTACRFADNVNLSKSIFENGLSLTGSTFDRAAHFSSMKIGRALNLDQTSFGGEVVAPQMELMGLLSARESHFNSPTGRVDFTSLKTGGDALFTRATFAGPVTFQSAQIGQNWRFDRAHFNGRDTLVSFEEAKPGAATSFVGCRFAGYISFKDAKFAALDFSDVAWPADHADRPWLWLNGMTYLRINAGSEKESWQNLHDLVQRSARGSAYSADVFAQLEDYYRALGYPREANAFFRAKKKREREEVLHGTSWLWSFFLDQFVGYGRSPERAILWSVAIIAIGCAMFRPNRMEPQLAHFEGRKYSAFWYSVDVYLPIIKLHDAEVWKPKERYVMTHVWRRVHTILGWALIPIALAAWTGMLSH